MSGNDFGTPECARRLLLLTSDANEMDTIRAGTGHADGIEELDVAGGCTE